MKRKTKAWKVIDRESRKSVDLPESPHAVFYPKDKWVKPSLKGSLLFVFETRKQARELLYIWGERALVVRCEVLNARPTKCICSAQYRLYEGYWTGKLNLENDSRIPPEGTLSCMAVKCLQ